MKILFITDYAGIGGGETSLLNTMREGQKNRLFDPMLYCCQKGELCNVAQAYNIPVWSDKLSFSLRGWIKGIPVVNPFGVRRLVKLIRKEKIDAVHINSAEVSLVHGMIAARLCRIPAFLDMSRAVGVSQWVALQNKFSFFEKSIFCIKVCRKL